MEMQGCHQGQSRHRAEGHKRQELGSGAHAAGGKRELGRAGARDREAELRIRDRAALHREVRRLHPREPVEHLHDARPARSHGLLEPTHVQATTASGRQHKLHYRATREGARAYRVWLARRLRESDQRSELLLRLLSVCLRGVPALDEVLERYEAECVQERVGCTSRRRAGRRRGADARAARADDR